MKILGLRIVKNSAYKELKVAAATALALVPSETAKAVQALRQSEIGAAVASDIEAIASKDMSGAEKFEAVLANTLPLVVKFIAKGGIEPALKEVEDIGRALVQTVFNDFKSSNAGKIAKLVLSLFKLI